MHTINLLKHHKRKGEKPQNIRQSRKHTLSHKLTTNIVMIVTNLIGFKGK